MPITHNLKAKLTKVCDIDNGLLKKYVSLR